jgi:uncharacterized protein (DUF362 family)
LRLIMAGMIGLALALLLAGTAEGQNSTASPGTPAPTARVVIVHDPDATENLVPVPGRIQSMVDRAITNLTRKADVISGWRSLVSTQDTVGIKVFSSPGPNSGTRVEVVAAVVKDLLAAGVPSRQIIVWDRQSVDLRLAGYFELADRLGIQVLGSVEAGYDENTFYDTALLGPMSWSDLEFGKKGPGVGRKSYVSKLVSRQMTKIINITPLMHHNVAGVSGNLYTLAFGSVDNTLRFESEPDTFDRAVPEIYALPILGDRVVLNIVDALICQYEGQDRGLLHYSGVLNELRFSRDPVALDVLSLEEINRERRIAGISAGATNPDLYPNASLLEIGVSDPKRIQVDRLEMPATP